MNIKSLFISKSLEEVPLLADFCAEHSIQLIAQSFLEFSAIPFQINASFDCIFFSSPRAVKFYLEQAKIPTTAKIACAGKSTKSILETAGYTVHFTPKESGNITQSAKEFARWSTHHLVLFPISSVSNKSYTKFLAQEQIAEVIVYETNIVPCKIPHVDCYVFTSPSNVKGFLESNKLNENAKVIAWGESTNNSLKYKKITITTTLPESSETSLIQLLHI